MDKNSCGADPLFRFYMLRHTCKDFYPSGNTKNNNNNNKKGETKYYLKNQSWLCLLYTLMFLKNIQHSKHEKTSTWYN